tara:strand:+ start:453 stop:767 length:315 start_codon:yes stop_codon:yes gene_type:complete
MHHGPALFDLLRSPRLLDFVEQFIGPEIYCNPVQHTRIKLPEAELPKEARTGLSGKKTEKLQEMIELLRPMYAEVREESVTWSAWEWPHWEGKRIQEFVNGLSK